MSDPLIPPAAGLLVLDRLRKHFPNGDVTAVDGVSLCVQQGEYLVIMGPSGCGKSTLMNLIGGLDTPTSGEAWYKGRSLSRQWNLDHYRAREIGFVFQAFHLLPTLSALENVQIPMFAAPGSAGRRAQRAGELLDLVGMAHRRDALPERMSIGERLRVAIARALANEPTMLLADEPTGNLDSENGEQVLDLFATLHRDHGMTLIVITHSDEVAARAGRVVFLRDGRIEREVVPDRPAPGHGAAGFASG
jgi:putative ABC transport system ATP-binding protein